MESSAKSESPSRLIILSTKEHRPVVFQSAERPIISMLKLLVVASATAIHLGGNFLCLSDVRCKSVVSTEI